MRLFIKYKKLEIRLEKYCVNCGESIPNRSRKCPKCGINLRKLSKNVGYTNNKSYTQEETSTEYKISNEIQYKNYFHKKNLFKIFPFFLIPGIGLMYAGNIYKGLKFLAVFLVVVFVDVFTKVVLQNYLLVFAIIPGYLIPIIWSNVAAVKELKIYNQNEENNQRKQYPSKKFDSSVYL